VATPIRIDPETGEVLAEAKCACPDPECPSQGKHPMTSHGAHDGSTDLEQIKKWWERWPGANVGISTGSKSGLWVLDVDVDRGGAGSFRSAYNDHGKPEPTVTAITGGGGRHILWRTWGEAVPCAVNFMPGVDTRGDGGLIVAPPSNHASGRTYRWHRDGRPGAVRVQQTPGWIRAMLRAYRNGGKPGIKVHRPYDPDKPKPQIGIDRIAEMHEGGRNSGLFGVVCRFIWEGREDILAAAHAVNQQRCRPPLPDREVDTMVKHALRRYG
jgi:hypothetical protein